MRSYVHYLLEVYTLCHLEDVDCTDGSVQLMGGQSSHEGEVEMCWNGVWTTINAYDWNYNNARVVCRQLGYYDQCKTTLKHIYCMLSHLRS